MRNVSGSSGGTEWMKVYCGLDTGGAVSILSAGRSLIEPAPLARSECAGVAREGGAAHSQARHSAGATTRHRHGGRRSKFMAGRQPVGAGPCRAELVHRRLCGHPASWNQRICGASKTICSQQILSRHSGARHIFYSVMIDAPVGIIGGNGG